MVLYGVFYSMLEDDTDVSYHSELFPEALIAATEMVTFAYMKNRAGALELKEFVFDYLKGIEHDLVHQEMVLAGNQIRG